MGFEPTPFQTSALNWRLRPLGHATVSSTERSMLTSLFPQLSLCSLNVFLHLIPVLRQWQRVRVVKETDLKSVGISRAGSNPAAVVLFFCCWLLLLFLLHYRIIVFFWVNFFTRMILYQAKKWAMLLLPARIELATFRLWDWRSTNWAKGAFLMWGIDEQMILLFAFLEFSTSTKTIACQRWDLNPRVRTQ